MALDETAMLRSTGAFHPNRTAMSMKLMWEIRAFCSVVEKRSFVHAARMLGRSPSAVTRAIQFLEDAIGAELILRTQKQFTLTTAGETYYASAKHLLETQAEAEDQLAELSNSPQGWVRISAPEILSLSFLPKVLAQFSRDYPNVSVDIHFSDKSIDPIQEKLDFSIRGAFPRSSELIGYPLWNYRRYMYASPDYIARWGAPVEPEELVSHDLIVHSAPRILRDWHFVSDQRNVRVQVQPRFRFTSGIATFQAAQEGAGIARLASWLAEPAVASGALLRVCPAYRLTSSKELDPSIHAVYGSARLPKGARLFLEYVRKKGLEIPDERTAS